MPCEPYQNALIEAAASGLEPQGELRAHLATCVACRTAFAQEQSLFSSIDAGLHAAVNVEVPVSLLPRVRTSIAEEPAVTRGWIPSWLTVAAAATIVVAFIAVYASLPYKLQSTAGHIRDEFKLTRTQGLADTKPKSQRVAACCC